MSLTLIDDVPERELLCFVTGNPDIDKMASATLPSDVMKVSQEGTVKLFGRWNTNE